MKKGLLLIAILFTSVTATFSQGLRLVVSEKPLNTVLNSLNVEISFDDEALSKYIISVSKTFNTPEEAISYLIKDKPLTMRKRGNVYVITYSPKAEIENTHTPVIPKKYTISGVLYDMVSGEPLPYAYIQTIKGTVITNESGYFSIIQETNQPTRIQTQYMGFEPLDTTLIVGNHKLSLSAKVFTMQEVVVQPSSTAMLMQSGKTSGEMRINHQIARYMPGSADNSVFTLLRMLPGVRASGEPSEDLFVWGSNWGESRLTYDGFTIFGMKSFNDQIGSVNPYLAKDIRLQKGGYDASSGNRIGAIAEITGNEGDFSKPSVKLNVSNYTANIYTSIPIKKTSALSVAYRQTFYNLYNNEDVNGSNGNHGTQTQSGTYIKPNYDFRDLNLKYAGKAFGNDRYHLSLYGADDHFKFYVKQQEYEVNATEKNRQYGASTGYNRIWNSGSNSKLLISYSKLDATVDNVTGITNNQATPLDVFNIKNSIQEISAKLEHNFNLGERQKIQIGGQWQNYTSEFNDRQTQINNPSLYITDNILLGKLSLKAGLRADLVPDKKIHIQPRLSASYSLTDELTATASFGLYNQFLTRIPYQYRQGSYQMIWNLSDSTYLSSTHYLAGLAYSKNGWLFSTEGYVKKNRNQLYFIDNVVSSFDNTVWGVDVYAKKEWNRLTAFGSYSFINSANPQEYTAHEVKLGAIYTLKSFHFSATYVYGSGFPYLSTSGHGHGQGDEEQQHGNGHQHSDTSNEPPYNRLDLSLTYKLQLKKIRIQTGASVLNVFNTNNVKYSYRLSNQNSAYNVYTKATPLTPVLFFEIIF
ncbi:TonB-dependent receptor [Massilibacteroides vaginae]|uniref:TonB-dependent receptor n=1 Tax=Massilibacteroides vaginae TaxID=1673718 RepID=UPI000A1CD0AB|nr:carboxypeptidase-like regulatory domain-containing protein [Massilibacteroides vaginae]